MLDEEALRGIAIPTLIVWTSHDPTGAVEVGEKFRVSFRVRDLSFWKLRPLASIRGPGEFNRLLTEFFR